MNATIDDRLHRIAGVKRYGGNGRNEYRKMGRIGTLTYFAFKYMAPFPKGEVMRFCISWLLAVVFVVLGRCAFVQELSETEKATSLIVFASSAAGGA